MPLPCSPVSMSERGDTSQSQSNTDVTDSEDDLITPRPGPAEAAQRTEANLSTPLPGFAAWSSERSTRPKFQYPTTSEDDEVDYPQRPTHRRPPPPRSSKSSTSVVNTEHVALRATTPALVTTTTTTATTNGRDSLEPTVTPGQPAANPSDETSSSSSKDSIADLESEPGEGRVHLERWISSQSRKLSPDDPASPPRHISPRRSSPRQSPKRSPKLSPKPSPRPSPKPSPRPSPRASPKAIPADRLGAAQDRSKSVTFSPAHSLRPDGPSSYSAYSVIRKSPGMTPDEVESSADEHTAVLRRKSSSKTGVGTIASYGATVEEHGAVAGYEGAAEEEGPGLARVLSPRERQRKSCGLKSQIAGIRIGNGNGNGNNSRRNSARDSADTDGQDDGHDGESWWKGLADKYGSVELENKGSVARDHLALERTFLAWLRTSLSFASIGIAVTQLFRLNTSLANGSDSSSGVSVHDQAKLRQVGKPLGATFLGISILILLLGFNRYFESQHYVIRGKFPASRGSIIIVSVVAASLIVTSLVVVVSIAPSAFEKR